LRDLAALHRTLACGRFKQQYGALCFRRSSDGGEVEILLITSRDTGRWVIPKGWPMKRLKPHEAAATEAVQEAGVSGKISSKPVGRYTYIKRLEDGERVPVMVELFALEVTSQADDFKEKGQRILEWMPALEASRRVQEGELKSILVNFRPKSGRKAGGGG
jgi:NUDIX domain.